MAFCHGSTYLSGNAVQTNRATYEIPRQRFWDNAIPHGDLQNLGVVWMIYARPILAIEISQVFKSEAPQQTILCF